MKPGDEQTIHVRSWNGSKPEGEVLYSLVLRRTERPYVFDLCDAYNERLVQMRGEDFPLRWAVNKAGQLYYATTAEYDTEQHRVAMEIMRLN